MHQQGERYGIPYQEQECEHAEIWQVVLLAIDILTDITKAALTIIRVKCSKVLEVGPKP